jgi:prolyl 4-hydroxylase
MKDKEFPKKIADNVYLYSASPIVYLVKNFLSDLECDAFINEAEDRLQDSTVIGANNEIKMEARTIKNCWIEHDANELVHEVSKRLSILAQTPIRNAEQYQLVFYEKGGEYKPHFDSFDIDTPEGKKNWEPGGQRMLTIIAYLNNVQSGGGTDFPNLGFTIPPKKGDIVVFNNTYDEDSQNGHPKIHPKSLHAGMPVLSGTKWIVNLWFRQNLRY